MNIGLIGYGAVAGLHLRALSTLPGVAVTVWGPDPDRARAFAGSSAVPAPTLDDLLDAVDAVLVASPSGLHDDQVARALQAGRSVLVEIPACHSLEAGRSAAARAADGELLLRAAHTSRYLAGYVAVGAMLAGARLGRIVRVTYTRDVVPRPRSWRDDVLRHHAFHPIDLLRSWFGDATVQAAMITTEAGQPSAIDAQLTFGIGVETHIAIRYVPSGGRACLRIEGEGAALETDGFSWLRADTLGIDRSWDAETTYAASIVDQDRDFVESIRTARVGPDWPETLQSVAIVDAIARYGTA